MLFDETRTILTFRSNSIIPLCQFVLIRFADCSKKRYFVVTRLQIKKMDIDGQMLKLLDILKSDGIIRFDKEFCEVAGLHPQNIAKIRKGETKFRVVHIQKIINEYDVNPNWIFGLEEPVFKKTINNKTLTQPLI